MLRQAGYTVVEEWECAFKEEKKTNPALPAFLNEFELVPPLNSREAFYGGRTDAVTMHCKVEEPDVIKYADVTSLYPWVNKNKEYPVGFPIVYTNPSDQDIHHYFGIALVEILPPQYLFHPVRTPLQSWWQTQVAAMCSLCERTAAKTLVVKNQFMFPDR